ncbi:MAG TPA: PEP-CTERM sorting domain-containing protein [Phycisphaerae bacterium]|nr:PEP-CTERM sorting domain-containing protein [Phycisphaerae bacterium]HRR86625.1 PEP-CTERM sorting domain-containing protein [Phycisphaerae bacterium]
MKKLVTICAILCMAATAAQAVFIVESRDAAGNLTPAPAYAEFGVWANAGAKSTAEGLIGVGSRYGSTYRSLAGLKEATFTVDLPVAGEYEVFVTWGAGANRRANIEHRIVHAGGITAVLVDQRATANEWVSLGTYTFNAGPASVTVSNAWVDLSGSMYADAVKWVPEPGAMALLVLGSLGGVVLRRRRA